MSKINWTEYRPNFKDCSVCSCVDRLVEVGVRLERELATATATIERLEEENKRLQKSQGKSV